PGQSSNLWAFPWRYDILWLFPLGTVDGIIVIIMTEEGGLTAKRAASPGKLLFRTQPEVLLLNFWPAWYLFFRASIPPMVKLYDELHRRAAETRAKYLGLVLDRPRASFARSFLQKIKLSYPQPWAPSLLVCSDFLHSTQELASARKIKEIPVVYAFNHQRKIVHVYATSKEEPTGELEKSLAIFFQEEK
ncbi:MAG: peroxiredoxin family protein, partial [Candidatus Aminicenantales bacterium]